MNNTVGFAKINGAKLYYEVTGRGSPVALIHGFTLDRRMWDDQVAALALRHQVVRYDLRGFGRSSLPSNAYSHVDDLQTLLNYLGIDRVALLGLSMGGAIALDFACAYPERLRAMLLADSTLRGFSWSQETDTWFQVIDDAARVGGVEAARRRWLAHPFFASANEHPNVAAHLRAIVADYSGWHWMRPDTQVVSSTPALEKISAPTLVIVGEHDIPDFRAISGQLARRIPHGQLVTLPGAGHLSNMERPDLFNQAVQRFLGDLE